MRYSYYPGCTLKTRAKELDRYARLSAAALGAELEELPEWQCCGAVYPMAKDEIATRLSAVRALMSARDLGTTLVILFAWTSPGGRRFAGSFFCTFSTRRRRKRWTPAARCR